MGMFKSREPRRYRPVSIYTDERRERLQKLVDEVRREQGEDGTDSPSGTDDTASRSATVDSRGINIEPDRFKGKFINYTPHLQRHKEISRRFGWPLWILLLFVMIVLWRFLLR